MKELNEKKKWYDSKPLVFMLLIVFFPVGLYALWKNTTFTNRSKGFIAVVWAVLFLFMLLARDKADRPIVQETPVPITKKADGPSELSLIREYHIKIDPLTPPNSDPLWVRRMVMKHIKDDFDYYFLCSVDLSIFGTTGEDHSIAEFKQGKGADKKLYRQFQVYKDGRVVEMHLPDSGIMKKLTDYSAQLYDRMRQEDRFDKGEFDRLTDLENDRLIQEKRDEYMRMVEKFNKQRKQ